MDPQYFVKLNGFEVRDKGARDKIKEVANNVGTEEIRKEIDRLKQLLKEEIEKVRAEIEQLKQDVQQDIDELKKLEDALEELEKLEQELDNNQTLIGLINIRIALLKLQIRDIEVYIDDNKDIIEDLKQQIDNIHTHDNKSVLDTITEDLIKSWGAKSNFSGSFDELYNVPDFALMSDLPTKLSDLEQDIKYFSEEDIIKEEIILDLVEKVLTPPESNDGEEDTEEPGDEEESEEPDVQTKVEFILYVGVTMDDIKLIKGVYDPVLEIVYC